MHYKSDEKRKENDSYREIFENLTYFFPKYNEKDIIELKMIFPGTTCHKTANGPLKTLWHSQRWFMWRNRGHRGESLISVALAICRSNLSNSCPPLEGCKMSSLEEIKRGGLRQESPSFEGILQIAWSPLLCRFYSEKQARPENSWQFNNSTFFVWLWTLDQRIRSLYKTISAETACSAT